MSTIGPTDGNLYALRQYEAEQEDYEARMVDCPACEGTGGIVVPLGYHSGDPETDDWDEIPCWACEGAGEIEAEDDE